MSDSGEGPRGLAPTPERGAAPHPIYNWMSGIGAALVTVGFTGAVFLTLLDLVVGRGSGYAGLALLPPVGLMGIGAAAGVGGLAARAQAPGTRPAVELLRDLGGGSLGRRARPRPVVRAVGGGGGHLRAVRRRRGHRGSGRGQRVEHLLHRGLPRGDGTGGHGLHRHGPLAHRVRRVPRGCRARRASCPRSSAGCGSSTRSRPAR